MEKSFSILRGERLPDSADHTYKLVGLPLHKDDFRLESNWEGLHTSWLKVEDVGFGADTFEFSQHKTVIEVQLPNGEGGCALIHFESYE